jgi:hypothetical protein
MKDYVVSLAIHLKNFKQKILPFINIYIQSIQFFSKSHKIFYNVIYNKFLQSADQKDCSVSVIIQLI